MPPSSSKTLSPAELAKLEHAFATDPASEAYKPLAEAYLAMGRFMEAMVVCKKGVKAHPTSADPRVLLARVYADQGKDKKALEELTGALQIAPNDKIALRMTGSLQMKGGEAEAGKANLMKAHAADPKDADTLALLTQHGIAVAAPAPPPPPPAAVAEPSIVVAAQPAAAAKSTGGHAAVGAPTVVPTLLPQPVSERTRAPAPKVNGSHPPAARAPAPQAARAPVRRTITAEEAYDDDDDVVSTSGPRRAAKKKSRSSAVFFLVLLIGGLGGVGVFAVFRNQLAQQRKQVNALLRDIDKDLKKDSYDAYIRICDKMEQAAELSPDNPSVQGYAAYAWTIRWAEHGDGDAARTNAEKHLKAAQSLGDTSNSLVAAQALFDNHAGKGKEAKERLEQTVKDAEAKGGTAGAQIYLALGLISMDQGDLQRAKEALDKAQAGASSDPRVYAALGNLYRRMGQDGQAELNYIYALRFEGHHPESLLGSALLELDKEEPDYGKVNTILKRLLEAEPPPSPRQLAAAHLARAYMISRVSNEIGSYKPEFQKQMTDATGVTADKAKASAEISKEEQLGFNLDKANPELSLIKAKRLQAMGDSAGAANEIKNAIKQDPTRAQFYVELAKVLMSKEGGEKEAETAIREAMRTLPDSPKLQVLLGQALQRQGKLDDAIAQYTRALSDPKAKNPEARLALGMALRDKKQNDKAIETLQKAAQEFVGNNGKVAEAQSALGEAYEAKGERAKADESYQAALNSDANFADAYYHYAKFLAASGDRKQAGKVSELAKKYLEYEPKGRFAGDATRLASSR